MADTAVDTTATAEVTTKVRFIQFFSHGSTIVLKGVSNFFLNFFLKVVLFVC